MSIKIVSYWIRTYKFEVPTAFLHYILFLLSNIIFVYCLAFNLFFIHFLIIKDVIVVSLAELVVLFKARLF